jgi:hypothetical protein
LIGTPGARFDTAADLSDSIIEASQTTSKTSAPLKLHFLRGDNPREREVVISLSSRPTREAA